jgi:hypothetical protein
MITVIICDHMNEMEIQNGIPYRKIVRLPPLIQVSPVDTLNWEYLVI